VECADYVNWLDPKVGGRTAMYNIQHMMTVQISDAYKYNKTIRTSVSHSENE